MPRYSWHSAHTKNCIVHCKAQVSDALWCTCTCDSSPRRGEVADLFREFEPPRDGNEDRLWRTVQMHDRNLFVCRDWHCRPSRWSWCPLSWVSNFSYCLAKLCACCKSTSHIADCSPGAGVLVNEFFPGFVKKIKPILPLVGVAITTLLCASPCAQVAPILRYNLGHDWHVVDGC